MQLTLPFPNSISNVNPSSMRWKSALENIAVAYIIENCQKSNANFYKMQLTDVLYSQSSEPGVASLPGPGGVAGPGSDPGWPPATPPVFLLSSELKKLASTPSLVVAAPGFTAVGSIWNAHFRNHETRYDFYNSQASYKCGAKSA